MGFFVTLQPIQAIDSSDCNSRLADQSANHLDYPSCFAITLKSRRLSKTHATTRCATLHLGLVIAIWSISPPDVKYTEADMIPHTED